MNQIPAPPIILSDIICNTISTTTLFSSVYTTNMITADFMTTSVINNGSLQIFDNKFNNVGTINGVVVQAHGQRHGFNDADPLMVGLVTDIKPTSSTGSFSGISNRIPRADHVHAHGNLLGGNMHAVVTFGSAGFMTSSDKNKLDGLIPNTLPTTITSVSSAGFLTAFARSDHVHNHGDLINDSVYHSLATNTTNGFMSPTDLSIIDKFSVSGTPPTLTISETFSVPNQPFGTVDGGGTQLIQNDVYTRLVGYWNGVQDLTNVSFENGVYTIMYPGYYNILANPLLEGNTSGYRCGYIQVTNLAGSYTAGNTMLNYGVAQTITPSLRLQSIEYLLVGDTVSVYVKQMSGTNINMATDITTQFVVCKLL